MLFKSLVIGYGSGKVVQVWTEVPACIVQSVVLILEMIEGVNVNLETFSRHFFSLFFVVVLS